MDSKYINKINNLFRNWIFWLIIVTGIAIIIRSIPAWVNVAWGGDLGIYFGLTKDFVETGELYNPYYGWGNSYNYFPVLYAIPGTIHWITGLEILPLLTKITPIFGGATVLIFYFLVNELLKNKKIAIISSLFLAILPFHVYQLSHASPLTMGHFFMILSLYFFVKYRKKNIYIYPLFFSTILLIMSHHLTNYFYLITLVFVVFFENASRDTWTLHLKKDVSYILFTSTVIFSYWAFIATPIYENFMKKGINFFGVYIRPELVIILFYVLFFASLFISRFVRKISKYLIRVNSKDKNRKKNVLWILYKLNPFTKKENPSVKSRIILFLISMICLICTLVYFTYNPLPWAGFAISNLSMVLVLPFLLVLSFAFIGFRHTSKIKNGFFIRGWIFALLISLFYALISFNNVILPYRHFEYIMYPISVLTAFGIGSIFSDPEYKKIFSSLLIIKLEKNKIKKTFSRYSNLIPLILFVLIISNGILVYPTHETLNESSPRVRDVIYAEDISAIRWIGENLDKNHSLIASDHCLERMIESEGFISSEDNIIDIWISENFSGCFDEIFGIGRNHRKITHILIDKLMKEEHVQYGFKDGKPRWLFMTNDSCTKAYDKFSAQPFELVYRNESDNLDQTTGETIFWAEVYQVNWTYINKILP